VIHLYESIPRGEGINTEDRAAIVLRILQENLTLPKWVKSRKNPFETLVTTILSQNTADRNTSRAFEALSKRFEISPEALAKAEVNQIEDAIRVAGLYKSKAKAIKQAAAIVCEKYHGTLQPLLSLPTEEARNALLQFSGVGPKTADVVLLFSANQPTIPVDTHVDRVAKRLGFAPAIGGYETVRENLQSLYKPRDYLMVHLLLIAHGRRYCRARRSLCDECPISAYCPSKGLFQR
jgi:endonuclease-3